MRSPLIRSILNLDIQKVIKMMKKVILFSVLAVSLTGCMVDPWDDDSGHRQDRNGHYDRHDKDRDWKNKDHRDWKNKDHRDWKDGRAKHDARPSR